MNPERNLTPCPKRVGVLWAAIFVMTNGMDTAPTYSNRYCYL